MMRGVLAATAAWGQPMPSLADPPGVSPLLGAALWVQNLVVGPVATVVAVIAVAAVGLMMLTGRLNVRRGGVVLCGCFILFGASGIAAGIRGAAIAGGLGSARSASEPRVMEQPRPALVPTSQPPNQDLYAGASVPPR